MGIFEILGGILDDYANNGKYPILSNNFTSIIIEMMIRDIKRGTASTIKDRAYTYARSLGWKLITQVNEIDPKKIFVNSGFSKLFHKFITLALRYYKEKRLAENIKEVRIVFDSYNSCYTGHNIFTQKCIGDFSTWKKLL